MPFRLEPNDSILGNMMSYSDSNKDELLILIEHLQATNRRAAAFLNTPLNQLNADVRTAYYNRCRLEAKALHEHKNPQQLHQFFAQEANISLEEAAKIVEQTKLCFQEILRPNHEAFIREYGPQKAITTDSNEAAMQSEASPPKPKT